MLYLFERGSKIGNRTSKIHCAQHACHGGYVLLCIGGYFFHLSGGRRRRHRRPESGPSPVRADLRDRFHDRRGLGHAVFSAQIAGRVRRGPLFFQCACLCGFVRQRADVVRCVLPGENSHRAGGRCAASVHRHFLHAHCALFCAFFHAELSGHGLFAERRRAKARHVGHAAQRRVQHFV